MADHQEQDLLRRFLQYFQQSVLGGDVQIVHRVDDRDPPAAIGRAHVEKALELANLLDGDLLAELLGLFIPGAAAQQHTRLPQ
jgi:hypothetical protein